MPIISLRVNDKEKELIEEFSKFNNKGVSTMIKDILLEFIEDKYDIKIADESYSKHLKNNKTYTLAEMRKKYDL